MRTLTALIVFSIASLAFTSANSPSSATAVQRYLPSCVGQLQVRPRTVYLACGDGNFGVKQLSWVAWGGARAVGVGRAWANDCQPSCVAGHTHEYPAVLILTGSQRCPSGKLAYRKLAYAFIGRSPFPPDAPGTLNPTQIATCKA